MTACLQQFVGPGGRVVVVDHDSADIERAKKNLTRWKGTCLQHESNIKLIEGDMFEGKFTHNRALPLFVEGMQKPIHHCSIYIGKTV